LSHINGGIRVIFAVILGSPDIKAHNRPGAASLGKLRGIGGRINSTGRQSLDCQFGLVSRAQSGAAYYHIGMDGSYEPYHAQQPVVLVPGGVYLISGLPGLLVWKIEKIDISSFSTGDCQGLACAGHCERFVVGRVSLIFALFSAGGKNSHGLSTQPLSAVDQSRTVFVAGAGRDTGNYERIPKILLRLIERHDSPIWCGSL
jgi:hypothetical protein